MEQLITIAPHPRVGVQIDIQVNITGDQLRRVTLFLSPAFVLKCPSKTLQRQLLPWLESYSQGQWTPFPVPPCKTPFTQKAASYLQSVPLGAVVSYSELAEAIGHPKAARAIGNFCRGNLFPLLIPCHRVIPASGLLGSFTPTPRIKEELLHFEGVTLS